MIFISAEFSSFITFFPPVFFIPLTVDAVYQETERNNVQKALFCYQINNIIHPTLNNQFQVTNKTTLNNDI